MIQFQPRVFLFLLAGFLFSIHNISNLFQDVTMHISFGDDDVLMYI